MSLDHLKERIAQGAHAVQDFAQRLRSGYEETRARHQLDRELDVIFQELGIEVYQRMRADDPVESSVVVQDLVNRLAEVELRLAQEEQAQLEGADANGA